MFPSIRTLTLAAAGALIWTSGSEAATSDPTGIWFDHNGRGAVEIAPCAGGPGLCGTVVHITDAANAKRCGMQILGNVTPDGGGWIYSPDRGRKYSVALTRLSDDKLRVVGNAGSFFSKTFTWKRAPDSIARCGEERAAVPAKPAETAKADAPQAPTPPPQVAATTETFTGATSASLALIGAPKRRPAAEEAPVPAAGTTSARPVATEKAAPATTTAAAPVADTDADVESVVPERKCKFKIPYVGRVISVPCRD